MEALGALAVAQRLDEREPASPFQSARDAICGVGYRTFHVETACATYFFLAD